MNNQCEIGLFGLGVMGAALAKNLISHQVSTALFSVLPAERAAFSEMEGTYILCETPEDFLNALKRPRKVFLMVTAGKAVDSVIEMLLPLLDKGDLLIDGGNSYYLDTERREKLCDQQGVLYLGVGVSGGEKGARLGPSMMVGGNMRGWEMVRPILCSIAAKHKGVPCCAYIAQGGAGHYVKMIHNGIEYAILELIAETYQYMRELSGWDAEKIGEVFESWNKGKLKSYLIEISALILKKRDEDGEILAEKVLDVAQQKGTGKWAVKESVERDVYVPTIYEAQMARNMSKKKEMRMEGSSILPCTRYSMPLLLEKELENALAFGIFLAYSQGFELIFQMSKDKKWNISCSAVAAVWENGCIIKSALLEEIGRGGFKDEKPLLFTEEFRGLLKGESPLRQLVCASAAAGVNLPGFGSALSYYDSYRTGRMPVYFIQALRDCFGAHTYQRCDMEGVFHTDWESIGVSG